MILLHISSSRSIERLPLLIERVILPPKYDVPPGVKPMVPGISMSSPASMAGQPECVAPQSDITFEMLAEGCCNVRSNVNVHILENQALL